MMLNQEPLKPESTETDDKTHLVVCHGIDTICIYSYEDGEFTDITDNGADNSKEPLFMDGSIPETPISHHS